MNDQDKKDVMKWAGAIIAAAAIIVAIGWWLTRPSNDPAPQPVEIEVEEDGSLLPSDT